METVLTFVVGLMARFLVFIALFALFAMPVVAVVYLVQAATAMRRRVSGTVEAGGSYWKPGLTYTAAHSWVKKMWGRSVKVGLDDVARRVLAGVSSLTLPPAGTKLRRGDVLITARCGGRLVALPSPVEGIVIERNQAVMSEPMLFEREPYGGGWMVRVETSERPNGGSHRGASSKAWVRSESLRLTRFLEGRLGMAAADGGTLTASPSRLLSDEAWSEAAKSFLQAYDGGSRKL